ncbi:MAG: prepilin peptidase [Armatimonadota bacterium]
MPTALFAVGAIFSFLFGITVGSFLNVCIYRLPAGESIVHPPSHCPRCNKRLQPADLVPLLSYLALGRKCRYCHTRISPRYFIIEFITGLLFIAGWWSLVMLYPERLTSSSGVLLVIALWAFTASMLVTFMIDLDTTYVIEPVTWVGMAAGVVFELLRADSLGAIKTTIGGLTIPYLPMAVPGMIIGFLVFVMMDLFGRLIFRKPGMGLGDSFIGAAIGAMLGPWLALLSFGIAIALGAVIGIVLIIAGSLHPTPAPGTETDVPAKKKGKDSASDGPLQETEEEEPQGRYMPFGPFLTASAMAVALAPDWFLQHAAQAWHWWLSLAG